MSQTHSRSQDSDLDQTGRPDHHIGGLLLAGVSKSYWLGTWPRRRSAIPVLDSVGLEAPAGSSVWVGGKNGSGKTTLLRVACGIMLPDSGSVSFAGLSPVGERAEYHRRTGFLSAGDRGIYARISVRRHLQIWARCAFVPSERCDGLIAAALADFGLDELQERRADRLSLGQRQRVKLAMTFLHQPRLVLLDEPTNSLDEEGLAALRRAASTTVARGGVVLWCSPPGERGAIDSDLEFVVTDRKLVVA